MAIYEELDTAVTAILGKPWDLRDGQVVPTTNDVALEGGGVKLEATLLYSDLADSTELASWDRRVAARVYKSFLACCSRLIRARGGEIRSFDGDRVMGVFIGDNKNSAAAKCALNINYTMNKLLKPKLAAKYELIRKGNYNIAHCTGIDAGEILVARSGIRNSNDLIWVGRAPNVAAKLSTIRDDCRSYLTESVFEHLHSTSRYSTKGQEMWQQRIWKKENGMVVYGSTWEWKP